MKLLGMQSLSCFFHSYSTNSSKGKKKKSWISHLIWNKQLIGEKNKKKAGFGINIYCQYHTHHVMKHRGKTEDKMGKGFVQVQDAQCPYTLLSSTFCPCLWQTMEIIHKVKRLPATFKSFLGWTAPKYPQVKCCGAANCLCQLSCICFLVLPLHWYETRALL